MKRFLILFVALVVGGCVQGGISEVHPAVYQTLEFVNDGHNVVRGVSVRYGSVNLPSGTAHQEYFPNRITGWSESHVYPIPESMTVHWISDDGESHDVVLPGERLAREVQHFAGFRFSFVDTYVDLYVINKNGPMELENVKVFSSK
jgi:hypothetical protein